MDPDPTPAGPQPLFSADFEQTFVQVRGCRKSIEHDLEFVRLLVRPEDAATYARCVVPDSPCGDADGFAQGALLVKAQYLDASCTELLRWTVAQKDAASTEGGGWRWQEVSAARQVTLDGAPRACVSCHTHCDPAFDLRCVMDP
jgi:hypothetical protein